MPKRLLFYALLSTVVGTNWATTGRIFVVAQDTHALGMSEVIESDGFIEPPLTTTGEIPLERFRKSFYQGSELIGGYLADFGGEPDRLNVTFEEARVNFAVPLGGLDNVLAIRPYFRVDHLDGPLSIDAPGSLYDTGVSLFHRWKWSDRFSSTMMLTPSVRSDFTTSDNAFRLFGLAMVNWQKRPDLSLSVGVVSLGRSDLPPLPVFGATWTPTPDWRIDAMMPRPRISKRWSKIGGRSESWSYLGGTLGGNTWAVSRSESASSATQLHDELSLSDLRLLIGYESIQSGNRGWYSEAGYSFNRSIEYEQTDEQVDFDDAVFVQAGWQF